jgi:AcrR family transcriptional regulator
MPTSPAPASRADKARATREHLIATAIDVVRQRTYGAATMFEVAKAAGVTPGALQHHFGSRATLMLSVLQAILIANNEASAPWPDASLPLPSRAMAFVECLWSRAYEPPRFLTAWSVYFGAADQLEMQSQAADMRRELRHSLHQRFAQVFPETQGRDDLPPFVELVLSALRGIGVGRLFGANPPSEAAQREQLAQVIATWCATPSPSRQPVASTPRKET